MPPEDDSPPALEPDPNSRAEIVLFRVRTSSPELFGTTELFAAGLADTFAAGLLAFLLAAFLAARFGAFLAALLV
ncbi:MAG: hypothetical protein QMC74_17690, partial [Myxococcota bacterium]